MKETGFVYVPGIPVQQKTTQFVPDDFVLRKGIKTRYGKKMLREDLYGIVSMLSGSPHIEQMVFGFDMVEARPTKKVDIEEKEE